MHNNPKAIPQVVVDKYPNEIKLDVFSLIGALKPP